MVAKASHHNLHKRGLMLASTKATKACLGPVSRESGGVDLEDLEIPEIRQIKPLLLFKYRLLLASFHTA